MVKILFPCLSVIGLVLLVLSVRKLVLVYGGDQQEFSATGTTLSFTLPNAGSYEIDVKRSSVTGVIVPGKVFELYEMPEKKPVAITAVSGFLSGRKDMSGNRIVPVARFEISRGGQYELHNYNSYRSEDRLVIMPAAGTKGLLMILATVFSGLLTIGGLLLSLWAFRSEA